MASASTAPPVGSNKLGLFMIGGSSKKLAIAGDPAFFDALAPREYSVVALTDCQILELSAPEYFEIFSKCPARLMPQGTGAIAALKSPPSTRTPLQLEWIKNFMSQQRFLSQLPADSITELAHTVTLRSYSKGEYGECLRVCIVVAIC